ncbi:MAG: 6-bladed beta-propeller [Phycisphaerales bacterium JB038]
MVTRGFQPGKQQGQARRRVVLGAMLLSSAGLVGCGQPAGEIFEPLAIPLLWPPAPEPSRIAYVGQLTSDKDLKPAVSFGQALERSLFGGPPTRTMLSPFALCTDSGGQRLFVCDSNAQVMHVFDLETRGYATWQPGAEARFAQPVAVSIGPQGWVLVCDSVAGVIHTFEAEGAYLGTFGEATFGRPTGLAWDELYQRLFVVDTAAHQVVVLSPEGVEIGRLGERGVGPGQFNFPTSIAVDEQGRLHVSDSLNFRVQLFTADLKPLRQIGRKGDLPGYFSQPKGLALDSEGHIYVVDAHFEAVQIFNDRGQFLLPFGEEGAGPGQFWLPAGIHIDSNDRIWIADTYNRRVQVFDYLPERKP